MLESLDYKYIIGVKPDGNKFLFDWVNAGGSQSLVLSRSGYQYNLRWFNDDLLNDTNSDVRVNFFEIIEISPKGKKQTFTWITNFEITKDHIYELLLGARARWKRVIISRITMIMAIKT